MAGFTGKLRRGSVNAALSRGAAVRKARTTGAWVTLLRAGQQQRRRVGCVRQTLRPHRQASREVTPASPAGRPRFGLEHAAARLREGTSTPPPDPYRVRLSVPVREEARACVRCSQRRDGPRISSELLRICKDSCRQRSNKQVACASFETSFYPHRRLLPLWTRDNGSQTPLPGCSGRRTSTEEDDTDDGSLEGLPPTVRGGSTPTAFTPRLLLNSPTADGDRPVHYLSERCALGCMQHDSRVSHATDNHGLRDKEKALFSNIDTTETFRSRSRTGEGASTPCSRGVQFRMRVKFHVRILNEFDLPRRGPNDTFARRSLNAAAGIRQRQSAPAMRVPSGHAGTRNPGTVLCTESIGVGGQRWRTPVSRAFRDPVTSAPCRTRDDVSGPAPILHEPRSQGKTSPTNDRNGARNNGVTPNHQRQRSLARVSKAGRCRQDLISLPCERRSRKERMEKRARESLYVGKDHEWCRSHAGNGARPGTRPSSSGQNDGDTHNGDTHSEQRNKRGRCATSLLHKREQAAIGAHGEDNAETSAAAARRRGAADGPRGQARIRRAIGAAGGKQGRLAFAKPVGARDAAALGAERWWWSVICSAGRRRLL
ncbi:hypothetical protein HPB50_015721 [Hyalomma asiaticum]|uniref:Uncharacterized protein n=1 Tax=Hyalomma asiaticum TaxID=266040 RepID=A0ACB7SZ86_HYAAI|nr:hypothetical protein HPB50_015721 [Hyalomma asiaticum]